MHIQRNLLMSYLFLVLSTNSLVCMEPTNNAGINTNQDADALYDRVRQNVMNMLLDKNREVERLAREFHAQDRRMGLANGQWSVVDQTTEAARINELVARKRDSIQREALALNMVQRNFHEALFSGNYSGVVGIRAISNKLKYNAPFPKSSRRMFIADINEDLYPDIHRASKYLLRDYGIPLCNSLRALKAARQLNNKE